MAVREPLMAPEWQTQTKAESAEGSGQARDTLSQLAGAASGPRHLCVGVSGTGTA